MYNIIVYDDDDDALYATTALWGFYPLNNNKDTPDRPTPANIHLFFFFASLSLLHTDAADDYDGDDASPRGARAAAVAAHTPSTLATAAAPRPHAAQPQRTSRRAAALLAFYPLDARTPTTAASARLALCIYTRTYVRRIYTYILRARG